MIFQTKHRALKSGRLITGALIPPVLMLSAACADASDRHRQNQSDPATGIIMESLDRGLVVIPTEQSYPVRLSSPTRRETKMMCMKLKLPA